MLTAVISNSHMNKRYLQSKIVVLLVQILLVTGTSTLHAETGQSVTDDRQGAAVISGQNISTAASEILRHIVDARSAIHQQKISAAESELQSAVKLIDYIKSVIPSTQIADHIWVAEKHLDSQKSQEVALDLIPIELSLTEIEEVYSVIQAKRHLDNVKSHLSQQEVEAARKELIQLRESLIQAEVDLPLTLTEQQIHQAVKLLSEADAMGADRALMNAEAGIRFVSLGSSTPLAKSRRLLWQAIEDYSAGRHDSVRQNLTQALGWLEQAKSPNDEKSEYEARRLRNEISELLDNELQRRPVERSELTGFWHKAVALIEREAENLYHAWHDQQSENHLYRQLIDARLHLYYAEHSLFESGDLEDAKAELIQCLNYLHEAESLTHGLRKKRIQTITNMVEKLNTLTSSPDDEVRKQYDEALLQLRGLIKKK